MSKLLEFIPVITFFLLYKFYNIFVATFGIAVSSFSVTFYSYIRTGKLSKAALINTVILIILGGLTLASQDSSFLKMKPTIVYFSLGIFLSIDLLLIKKYYIQKLYAPLLKKNFEIHLNDTNVWKKFTLQWIFALFCLAFMNEMVWRFAGESTWVNFKVFIIPVILTCVVLLHINSLSKRTRHLN